MPVRCASDPGMQFGVQIVPHEEEGAGPCDSASLNVYLLAIKRFRPGLVVGFGTSFDFS